MFQYAGIAIRNVEAHDLEDMRRLRNDPSTWIMLTEIGMIDSEEQHQWFENVRLANGRKYYVVCDSEHEFIGIVRTDEIDRINRSIRIGADIIPALRGMGYGTRLYGLLKAFCFDHLNMHRVWLAVIATNDTAFRIYEKNGFKVEGRYREAIFRDGRYHDYVLMSILENEYRAERE